MLRRTARSLDGSVSDDAQGAGRPRPRRPRRTWPLALGPGRSASPSDSYRAWCGHTRPVGRSATTTAGTTGTTAQPLGACWNGVKWRGATWAGATWAGATWASDDWDGATWAGATWAGATWAGATWAGATWAGATWAD